VFHSQVFLSGFVHSDPHPANVLVRKHPKKQGKPQLVLVDHGLYKEIDNDFRILYAHLYKSLLLADVPAIKATCEKLGITKMVSLPKLVWLLILFFIRGTSFLYKPSLYCFIQYTLLSAMLTSRPFDEIIERNKSGGFAFAARKQNGGDAGDKAMIRGYAQTYFRDIIAMLDVVPRQMLLLFKMNDCLRHLDFALGVPSFNSLIISGRLAATAILRDDIQRGSRSLIKKFFRIAEHVQLLLRIKFLELIHWWGAV
jgi:aarF domain-containing kinase